MLFARSGLRLSPLQAQQFWTFHQLLRERNAEQDLTRLHAFDAMVLKHYVDCALVATLVDLPSPLLDLGTGAGFPAIPLKIVRPDIFVYLNEPRGKRVAFLREAIGALGLRDVEVLPHRIGARFDRPVRGVITRAVETIGATLERVAPWLEPGSRVLFMKGPGVGPEAAVVGERFAAQFRITRDVAYTIPETPHERRLIVAERLAGAAGDRVPIAAATAAIEVDSLDAGGAEGDATRPAAAAAGGRETREILSDTNPTFKLLRAGLDGRGIRKHGRALVAGARPAHEIVRDFPQRALAWITAGTTQPPPADAPATLAWYRLAPALFRELDAFGTGGPLLWIDAPALPPWEDTGWPAGCTLFVPFQDPENVGAVVRTAAAFGVARVVLLAEAANPFHPRSARAAGSALLRVPLLRGPAIRDLAPGGAPVVALSPGGRDIGDYAFPEQFGLVVGLEGQGLPEAWRDGALGIPMAAGSESLNAAAATAIALHLWSRSRRLRP
jgi:16S rRNA (guanine527-N7)-methyltransferase